MQNHPISLSFSGYTVGPTPYIQHTVMTRCTTVHCVVNSVFLIINFADCAGQKGRKKMSRKSTSSGLQGYFIDLDSYSTYIKDKKGSCLFLSKAVDFVENISTHSSWGPSTVLWEHSGSTASLRDT